MNKNRVLQLETYLKASPNDPFIIYALALEYIDENVDYSLEKFRLLLDQHADYLPTYYHSAQLMHDLDLIDEARHTYEKGIEKCEIARDTKALNELKSAYQNFLFETED